MLIYTCLYCHEEKEAGDSEEAFARRGRLHEECLFRMVTGSAAHQLKECACYGGEREDAPNLTKRDAARLAVETYKVLSTARGC